MKALTTVLLILMTTLLGARAMADDAALQIHGDLMIHPDQMSEFFTMGGNQIRNSQVWSWPALSFTAPYKTSWTNVLAHGPFDIQFDTSSLKTQEFGFTLTWANPSLSVGNFEIHDQIKQTIGGVPVTVNLDGACANMQLNIPGGQWTVKGKMHWDFVTGAFTTTWENFALAINAAAVPAINLGQCQGPAGLLQTLQSTITKLTGDQAWLQDVLKAGTQDWVQSTLGTLSTQLLTARDVKIKDAMKIQWVPSDMTTMAGGLIRVAGTFNLSKPGSTVGADQLPRNYDPAILTTVTESGFVMPKDSMQRILKYMYSNGELQYRINSSSIASFVSLMNNWFLQFFIWPDLLNFASNTNFYFDLSTQGVPSLGTGGMLDAGGSSYPFTAPMVVHQWAPGKNGKAYVPYLDFTAPVTGNLQAQIANGNLTLQMQSDDLNVLGTYRSEYTALRYVNTWIATWLLGSSVKDYLNSTPFTIPVPNWQLSSQLSLGMRDLQVWKSTFRIPLQFTTSTPAAP